MQLLPSTSIFTFVVVAASHRNPTIAPPPWMLHTVTHPPQPYPPPSQPLQMLLSPLARATPVSPSTPPNCRYITSHHEHLAAAWSSSFATPTPRTPLHRHYHPPPSSAPTPPMVAMLSFLALAALTTPATMAATSFMCHLHHSPTSPCWRCRLHTATVTCTVSNALTYPSSTTNSSSYLFTKMGKFYQLDRHNFKLSK